jgi:hypothetical protein
MTLIVCFLMKIPQRGQPEKDPRAFLAALNFRKPGIFIEEIYTPEDGGLQTR